MRRFDPLPAFDPHSLYPDTWLINGVVRPYGEKHALRRIFFSKHARHLYQGALLSVEPSGRSARSNGKSGAQWHRSPLGSHGALGSLARWLARTCDLVLASGMFVESSLPCNGQPRVLHKGLGRRFNGVSIDQR